MEEENNVVLYSLTLFIYDEAGNKITERRSRDFVDSKSYSNYYHELHFAYDKNNRLIEVKDNSGAKIKYGYDCLNNKTYEASRINEENYRRIYYKYDSIGNLIETKQEIKEEDLTRKNSGRAVFAITTYEYDKNGNIIGISTPKGHKIKQCYDSLDRVTVKEEIDKESGIFRRYEYGYDKSGNITFIKDTNNNTRSYNYDYQHRLTHFTNENGHTTRLFYDKNSRIIKEVLPEQYDKDIDDGAGVTIKYDPWDRVKEIRNPLGQLTKENHYDSLGNIKEAVDGLNNKVEFTYNLAGLMKKVITPNSREKGRAAQSYSYDSRGNIIGICDGNGNETRYNLDDWGRITEIINPDGSIEKYTYDYAGNINSTQDGNGNIIEYVYNSINKVKEIKDQQGESKYFYYDLEENLKETVDRNGNYLYYGYNIDKNITYRKDGQGTLWETFEYNKDGTLSLAKTLGMAYSYSYTKDLKLKSKATCGRSLLAYEYNKNGNIESIEDISGKAARYSYDNAGRVETVYDEDKTMASYSYNSDDSISSIVYGNKVTTKYSYDGDKNITSLLTETSTGEVLIDYNYVYDLNGNRLQKVGSKHQSHYTYDSLNRLSSARYKTPSKSLEESFTYDKAGNRLSKTSNNIVEKYKYSAKNQLLELEKPTGTIRFSYDKEGNLTKEHHPEGITSYNYNSFNQTTKVETKEGNTLVSRYDAEGLRVEIEENERLTRFIFNKENIIAELDKDNNVIVRLTRGHEVIGSEIEETRFYYHQEEQGSTAYITNEKEEIENSYFYDAFGVLLEAEGEVPNRITYTGQQYDSVTQQYYLRARNYNPVIGRFTQEDTYRGDGLNLYDYCHSNPVIYYDPSGYMYCGSKKNSFDKKGNIKRFEVTDYDDFRNRSIKGDNLEGHELLQHAYLRDQYLAPNNLSKNRLSSNASKNNPVIALDRETHKIVNKLQQEIVPVTGVKGRQHIEANIRVLRYLNIPRKKVNKLAKKAVKHALDLGIF
ncbi:RHS repeat-associated protein [Clostridium punense]|uniref:RHS repeat-associated protein n=1 Tax=Clostridium punense TaxID=1054297 RepID=A0ABS4K2A1_9CLOT|nr:RHS repeat-associated protein [Clostridium punense]